MGDIALSDLPLVSVVMVCHNESHSIAEAVHSVLGQTYQNIELIVVDDDSTDDTVSIIGAISDDRLTLLRQQRAGACVARNAGFRRIRGALVQFMDGDDSLAPDKIERQIRRWREEGDQMVYFGPFGRFESDTSKARFTPTHSWRDMSGPEWLASAWRGGGMMPPHAWLTPVGIARAAGDWDESILQNQDGEYFSRVLLASDGVRFCPEACSYYREGVKASISKRKDHAARASRLKATQAIVNRLTEADQSRETRQACGNILEEMMMLTYPQYPDLSDAAASHMKALGGGDGSRPYRGRVFKFFAAWLGWRLTRHLQSWWNL